MSAQCRRILMGTTYAQDAKVVSVLSLGPLTSSSGGEQASGIEVDEGPPALCPRISFGKADSGRSILTVDIPSAYVHATKPSVDGLQYLADDVTQFLDRTLGSKDEDRTEAGSMIGSDFFAGGSRATSTTDRASGGASSEFVVKLNMSEGESGLEGV